MAGSGAYARHGFVRWSVIAGTLAAFCLSTVLYGLPLAVFLSLLASCAYCAVTHLSFTLDGRDGRLALGRAYDKLFSSLYSSGTGEPREKQPPAAISPSRPCHKEAQKMIRLITRDFLLEWYKNVASEGEFPDGCQKLLEHVALEINIRVQQINLDELVQELLSALLPYLVAVNQAGRVDYNSVEIFDINHERCVRGFEANPAVAHRALRSPEAEARHLRQVLDSVIQCALPEVYGGCDVTCLLLREVLLGNIVEPVLSLVCDPDFLNKAIPVILRKADPVEVQTVLDHIQEENRQLECDLIKGRLIQAHRKPTRFHSMSEHFPMSTKPIPVPLSRIYQETPVAEEGVAEEGVAEEGVAEDEAIEEIDMGMEAEEEMERDGDLGELSEVMEEADGAAILSHSPPSSLGSSSSSLADTPTLPRRVSFLGLPFPGRKLSRRQTIANAAPQQQPQATPTSSRPVSVVGVVGGGAKPSPPEDPDMVCVDLPPVFATRYLHIRHQNNSAYIGYVFKFPKTMLLPGDLQELGVASDETHLETVKRYSDFTRLHQQLHKSPAMLRLIRGLDLPEKHGFANLVSKLPFTSRDLDPTTLLERKQGLEKYIQLMSSRQDILESRIFQDFLKSGVILLREINSLQSYKSRQKRTLLGIVKGHSDDTEEAQPLPKRPLDNVLSSFLNTTLPLPCRNLNTPTHGSHSRTAQTSKTSSPHVGHRKRRERLTKAATVSESPTPSSTHWPKCDKEEERRHRSASLTDSDQLLMKGAKSDLWAVNSNCRAKPLAVGEFNDGCHGNGVAMDTDITTVIQPQGARTPEPFLARLRYHLSNFWTLASLLTHRVLSIIHQCSLPFTPHTLHTLTVSQQQTNPLSDAILSLATEASSRHCPELWAIDTATQTAVLTLVGGAIDRFLSQELRDVVEKEQNWVRMLYRLRHILWVDGHRELDRSPRETLTEAEREERKKMAVAAFRKFLPNFLPYVVGEEEYGQAVTHCLECLQNPHINRHFFLRVVDILLPKLIPELHSDEFQKRLARLRTLTSTHHSKRLPHPRPHSKKH